MHPIILSLLKQEPVTQAEWQDLFYSVHQVCLDEIGPPKLRDALKEDIMEFIKQAQQVFSINCFFKLKVVIMNIKTFYKLLMKVLYMNEFILESYGTSRRTGFVKSLHSGMEKIFYPV